LKNKTEKLLTLIEAYCKKKIVITSPLLLFGKVREAYAHCTHLQSRTSQRSTKALQKSAILPALN
jgi:hypothetical protein